jgi:predicted DNA-binding transcriptional regulator YafY
MGAPIAFDFRRKGFHYTQPSYRLPLFQFTQGELAALLVSVQVMHHYKRTPFETDLKHTLARIAELLPDKVKIPLDDLAACITVLPRAQTTYDPKVLGPLMKALYHSRQVRILYRAPGRDEPTRRTVDPYVVALTPDDDWSLIGHCHLRNAVRMFKVQRIRSVEETGEVVFRRDDFQVSDYMAGTFGTIRGESDHHVVLRFSRAQADRIAERDWHESQVLEPQPDGRLILRLHLNDLRLIKRWVMFWGADCEVLEPKELRESLVAELKAMARLYRRQGNNHS